MKKLAFTIIELVFVIVIIGIVVSLAVPKLAATRDDAKLVRELANAQQCVIDACASYTATEVIQNDITSCLAAETASIVRAEIHGDTVTVTGDPRDKINGDHVCSGRRVEMDTI